MQIKFRLSVANWLLIFILFMPQFFNNIYVSSEFTKPKTALNMHYISKIQIFDAINYLLFFNRSWLRKVKLNHSIALASPSSLPFLSIIMVGMNFTVILFVTAALNVVRFWGVLFYRLKWRQAILMKAQKFCLKKSLWIH